jgi:hypothetical protein
MSLFVPDQTVCTNRKIFWGNFKGLDEGARVDANHGDNVGF